MKKFLLVNLFLMLAAFVSAQSTDILFLKNGSMLRGEIVEMNPGTDLKFKTADGSLFVYSMSEIDRLEKIGDESGLTRIDSRFIEKEGKKLYFENGGKTPIPDEKLIDMLGYDTYNTYIEAQKQVSLGDDFLVVSGIAVGVMLMDYILAVRATSEDIMNKYMTLGQLVSIPADAFIAMGCIFRGIGNGRLRWVQDSYNGRPQSKKVSLKPSMMLSSQNDLAFGATLRIGF